MQETDEKSDDSQQFYPENSNVFPIFSLPTVNQFSGVMRKVVIACTFCIFLGVILIAVGIASIFVPSLGPQRIYHPLCIGSSVRLFLFNLFPLN